MKKQIIAIGSILLMTYSMSASYADSNMSDHNMTSMGANVVTKSTTQKKQEQTIKLDVLKIENKGNKKLVQIKLRSIKDNKPIMLQDLKQAHTQKVHLLIIDDALEDYSHIHPKALKEQGLVTPGMVC